MDKRMAKAPALVSVISVFLLVSSALSADEPAKSYKSLRPLLTVDVSSLYLAEKALDQGLSGSGFASSAADAGKILAGFCNLPSFDFADKTKPVKYFLLTQTPITAAPDFALVVPMKFLGEESLSKSLDACYMTVKSGNLKTYSDPKDAKWPASLFVVTTPKQAFIATSFDAVRWMMSNFKAETLPSASDFRKFPFSATLDAHLCSELISMLLSNMPETISEEATYKNTALHMREFGVLCGKLNSIDIALNADMMQWDAAIRLNFPEGSYLAQKLNGISAPLDEHLKMIPPLITTRNVSAIPAFVSLLPPSNRKWLASLAVNTQILGTGILPGLFDVDEKLRLFTEGVCASAYIIDSNSDISGKVSVFPLKNQKAAEALLFNTFSKPGKSENGSRATVEPPRKYDQTPVFSYTIETDKSAGQTSGIFPVAEAIAFVLQMNTVEIAVAHGKLIVAQGTKGLIYKWIENETLSTWDEQITSFSTPFQKTFLRDTFLGGGLFDSVALSRQIVTHVQGLRPIIRKMPQSGGGISWRMVRSGSASLVFDIQPKCGEIMGIDQISKINSDALHEFIAQIVLKNIGNANGGH